MARTATAAESETGRATERIERAATLLLAASVLAGVALLGWGGLTSDLQLPQVLASRVMQALVDGAPVWPVAAPLLGAGRTTASLWPLAGTVVTVLFAWHVISLAAELLLLAATGLCWVGARWLHPVWVLLDVLDSAPLATPKRMVVAAALAAQITVRSAVPIHAAPAPAATVVMQQTHQEASPEIKPPPQAASEATEDQDETPWLVHHVTRGDTLRGISRAYYGDEAQWPSLFRANYGAVMAYPALGLGHEVRLTNPDYILPGWDMPTPPVPGHLETGPDGQVAYIVHQGDTLGGIAARFGVDVEDLWTTNEGATTPDGRVFEQPDEIWPGLPLQVQPLGQPAASATAESEVPDVPSVPVAEPAPPAPTPAPATPVPTEEASAPSPTLQPVAEVIAEAPSARQPAEAPARPTGSEPALPLWPLAPLAVGLLGVAVGAAALRRPCPETDLEMAEGGRVAAVPARVLRTRAAGDPLELLTGELIRVAGASGIADVDVVFAHRGNTATTDEQATLGRILSHGLPRGLRVLAATTDLDLAAATATDAFSSRAVSRSTIPTPACGCWAPKMLLSSILTGAWSSVSAAAPNSSKRRGPCYWTRTLRRCSPP